MVLFSTVASILDDFLQNASGCSNVSSPVARGRPQAPSLFTQSWSLQEGVLAAGILISQRPREASGKPARLASGSGAILLPGLGHRQHVAGAISLETTGDGRGRRLTKWTVV